MLQIPVAELANRIRMGALTGIYHAKSGHPGGSLSVADILAVLYGREMRYDPQRPDWEDRDRFVLSKGHCAPALYAALAECGFFPTEELTTLRHTDSRLQGHPDMRKTPGVDMTTGSLGQGISAACGMAISGKLRKKDYRVYTVIGDGESEEGQVWEAAMAAAKYKLDNLCAIIDHNGLQIDGRNDDVMPVMPLDKKFEAFNWNVLSVNGHDYDALSDAFDKAAAMNNGKPTVVIMETIKGKGVSYMENNAGWHGKAPNDEQYAVAISELEAYLKELEG